MTLKLSEVVASVGEINFHGNVIPHEWFNHIVNKEGKVNINAIVLLSEIVYWHRPAEVYENNKLVGVKDKFDGDMLQKSYQELSEKFNLTKTQVKRAMDLLVDVGVVKREFRNLTVRGHHLSNVMFLSLDVEILKKLTHPHKKVSTPLQKGGGGTNENSDTYTKITTNITTETTQDIKDSFVDDKSPTPPARKKGKRIYEDHEEPLILAKYLYQLIKRNNQYAKEPNYQTWANDIRLMHESDGIEYSVIKNCISWCQQDSFWSINILSAKKLREKFVTLYGKAQQQKGERANGNQPSRQEKQYSTDDVRRYFDQTE